MCEQIWGDSIYIYWELWGKAGLRLAEMVGKSLEKDPKKQRKELIAKSSMNQVFLSPLPFWFTEKYCNVLPNVGISLLQVQFNIEFLPLDALIIRYPCDIVAINNNTGEPVRANDVKFSLLTQAFFVDCVERSVFANNSTTQLITQWQRKDCRNYCGTQMCIPLCFQHCCKEIIFYARRASMVCMNMWTRFDGLLGMDAITDFKLTINNCVRVGSHPMVFYNQLQPFLFHSHFPSKGIYVYSFALYPEECCPSGWFNFSRAECAQVDITLQQGLQKEQVQVTIFAVSFNILCCIDGLCGPSFL
jgi:hypothetical protein